MGTELGLTADSKPEARLDSVGIWWICWSVVWTLLLLAGAGFLILKRNTPMLRIRGIGLSLSAIFLLHLFWIAVQLGYVIGPLYPGDTQYWIMGTYLPLGIGLFHGSNSRFLHIAQRQKKYLESKAQPVAKTSSKDDEGFLGRFRRLDHTAKVILLVGSGMLFQVSWRPCAVSPQTTRANNAWLCQLFMTIFMYMISRKWHSSWGIPGTEVHGTDMEQKVQMGRGWEWSVVEALNLALCFCVRRSRTDRHFGRIRWPSIIWQLFWAWVIAPVNLWRARAIRGDTQGWRTQTILCAISK